MKIKKKLLDSSGQTIIEAVVALSVLLVIMGGITVLSSTGLNNTSFEKDQGQASKYAKQGIEYIRYLRNTGTDLTSYGTQRFCMSDSSGSPTILAAGEGSPACQLDQANLQNNTYIREVEFVQSSVNCNGETQAIVRVKWSSGKCDPSTQLTRFCHKSEITSCFDTSSVSAP